MIRIAQDYFYYLADTRAKWNIVAGDARLALETALAETGPENFDVLVMDAFSSDAIPMHLLTSECVAMYWRHLKPDGILAVNISNRNVDLDPVIRAMADAAEKQALVCESGEDPARGTLTASWALLMANGAFLYDASETGDLFPLSKDIQPVVWTDDYGSLWQVLRKFEWPTWDEISPARWPQYWLQLAVGLRAARRIVLESVKRRENGPPTAASAQKYARCGATTVARIKPPQLKRNPGPAAWTAAIDRPAPSSGSRGSGAPSGSAAKTSPPQC